jgi:hypothetical protein
MDKMQHFYYNRNKKSLSKENYDKSADYGRDLEPAGEYMNIDSSTKLRSPTEDWESGTISFRNPLHLEHKSTDSKGWKKDLSDRFGGLTGKKLTAAIKKAGHDAIITKNKYGFSETVNLGGIKNMLEELPRRTVTSEDREDYIKEKMEKKK